MAALSGVRSFPRRLDLARLDDVAGLVAPVVALVGDDRGDVGVRELLAKSGHCGALLALEHHLDVRGPRTVDELGAVERGERSFYALPVCLVAGDAAGRIDLFAPGLQLGELPFLV